MDVSTIWAEFWQALGLNNHERLWLIEVFVVVFVTLLINLVVSGFMRGLSYRADKSSNVWDDILIKAVRRPLSLLIWVVGLSWGAQLVDMSAENSVLDAVEPMRQIAVIVILSWFLIRLVKGIEGAVVQPDKFANPMDETTAQAVGKLLRASIFITTALVILQSLGYSISGVLAFGGIGGIAVGFAAKDLLANFFGGLMVYMDRPFAVGDWIRSPDKDIEGVVENIGWRQTRIRTFTKRPLYVPNATFTNISVENPSRMQNRRIFEVVGVRYDDAFKVKEIVDEVREMVANHDDIATDLTMIVHFDKFAASSLEFFVYAYTKTTEWVEYHRVKEDVMLKIISIVENHGAEFAFPTSTIHAPGLLKKVEELAALKP